MQDFSNEAYRKQIIDEILGNENMERKRESFKRSEIYNKRAGPFIDQKLKEEFPDSADKMRKVKSINPAKRMVDAMASIYREKPVRDFMGAGKSRLNDAQTAFLSDTYELGGWNTRLQRANRILKYQNQVVLQVLPLKGYISGRVYQPHEIDCVPMETDPESAYGYVISAYDKSKSLSQGDGIDQKIADKNDATAKSRAKMRFVWWSAQHNLISDGNGALVGAETDIKNPIDVLPFVEISAEKENEFWVRKGSSVCDFTIDLGVILSDTANTNRLQGYGQPVVIAKENPGAVRFGPDSMIYLKSSEEGPQPDVKFINASPDLDASMRLITTLMNLFATSEGQSPKLVSATGEAEKYTSGVDRFLAQLEAFEASKEDIELFKTKESELFDVIIRWANVLSGTSNSGLKMSAPQFAIGSYVQTSFKGPELIQNRKEKEESEFYLVEKGVSSLVMAVMNIFGIDEEAAIERIKKVREQQAMFAEKKPSDPPSETEEKLPADGEETADAEVEGDQELLDLANKEPA